MTTENRIYDHVNLDFLEKNIYPLNGYTLTIEQDEISKVTGHRLLKVMCASGSEIKYVFVKEYNVNSKHFDAFQMAKTEIYAMDRAKGNNVHAPEVIYSDTSGLDIIKPVVVSSFVDGIPLNIFLDQFTSNEQSMFVRSAHEAFLAELLALRKIKNSDSSFGPIFQPSWIKDISDFNEFLRMGLYREFWRAGMLDESYTFHSDWAKKVFIKCDSLITNFDIQSFNLCHGDPLPKNIIVNRHKNKVKIAGIIDWEYAYWGVSEKDLGDFLADIALRSDFQKILTNYEQFYVDLGLNTKAIYISLLHRLLIMANNNINPKLDKNFFYSKVDMILNTL